MPVLQCMILSCKKVFFERIFLVVKNFFTIKKEEKNLLKCSACLSQL